MNPSCDDVKVVDVRPLGQSGRLFELWLDAPTREWTAGQFVMVRPAGFGLELTWARPFSIYRWDERGLGLLIQIAGRGTELLSKARPGDDVAIWGPLGQGFAVEPETPTLLLAGGVGLAPLSAYAALHPAPENLELVFGHRELLDCYPWSALPECLRCQARQETCAADLEAFIGLLSEKIAAYADKGLVLACGPQPFLRTVRREAAARGARCQISLENRMACGVGACLGCVSKDASGWPVQVCTRGPVFWADQINLDG